MTDKSIFSGLYMNIVSSNLWEVKVISLSYNNIYILLSLIYQKLMVEIQFAF